MDIEKAKGYDDQELLLRAFVAYASKKINRSEQILKGMMRQSIHDGVSKHNITLKEIRFIEEDKRLIIFNDMVDIFLEKISHVIESKYEREKLKADAINIYEHWKKTKRVDPSKSLLAEMEQMMEEEE